MIATCKQTLPRVRVEQRVTRAVVAQGRRIDVRQQVTRANVETRKVVARVLVGGLRGEQGPPGTSGSGYVHTQSVAAATWTINHNLGFRPSVELIDAGGAEFDGEIVHPSINQTVVYLDEAAAGLARLN